MDEGCVHTKATSAALTFIYWLYNHTDNERLYGLSLKNIKSPAPKSRTLRYITFFTLFWTTLLATSLAWNLYVTSQNTLESARIEARSAYDEAIVYMSWNTEHGGVYVEDIEKAKVDGDIITGVEKKIVTTTDKKLRLVNPAAMMREVNTLSNNNQRTITRLTSINPLNSENSPDAWEVGALSVITSGVTEYSSIETANGKDYMRFMKPVVAVKQCISCHNSQGLKAGDIAGALSATVPMGPLTKAKFHSIFSMILAHSTIWLAGLFGLHFMTGRLKKSEARRLQAELELRRHTDKLEEMVRERTTELEHKSMALEHQTLHDGLTGLPNRSLLIERALQSLQFANRDEFPCSLLMLDLNRFKEVNDALGHHVGDLLLQEVARRLKTCLRASDTLARLGGDEFAIVLPKLGEEQVTVITKILLDVLNKPFELAGKRLYIGGSIGIAFYPKHGDDTAQLMQRADVAMYHAKRNRLGFSIYSQEIDSYTQERLSLRDELRHAVEKKELIVYYQPKLEIHGDKAPAMEALVRWPHPVHGIIGPDRFIPLAEESGLINPLTLHVLELATKQCAAWRREGLNINVSVNLSTHNLREKELAERIAENLRKNDLPPGSLVLEITESMLMEDPLRGIKLLKDLQDMGVESSIDDFGTGYSSLSYLRQLPVEEIKIDRSFVMNMRKNQSDEVIVRAIIDLAHNLGLRVVAEGAESQEDWDMLARFDCDIVQGYFISRPLPAEEITVWLRKTFGVKINQPASS